MKILLTFIFLMVLYPASSAQNIEYGKTSELKGVKKIFIDCGVNIKSRDLIIKELDKANLGIEILESADDAEVVLQFEPGVDEIVTGNKSKVSTVKRPAGVGIVFIPKGDRQRILLSFEDIKKHPLEKKPETNFAKAFIKAYKEANKD